MLSAPRPLLVVSLLALLATAAAADVVVLESGGRLVGQLVNQEDGDRDKIYLELAGGGRVTLNRSDVRSAIPQSAEASTYQQRAATVPDTAEANWDLAKWCRTNRLDDEAKVHTRRVIELDPNHEEARQLLGYSVHRGKWMTRDELMESRGLVRYDGRYRTPQEVELLQRSERGSELAVNWKKQLARWRRDLGSSKPQEAMMAAEELQQLRNPAAASALVRLLSREQNLDVRDLLIATAAQIDHPATVQALATLSLNSQRHEERVTCLEHLIKANRPGLAEIYTRSLSSASNPIVNRAGAALGMLGAEETLGALIGALITTHEFKAGPDAPGETNIGMDSRGGFTFGNGKAEVIRRDLRNPEVRTALVQMTGENFGYDEQAWRRWLANRTTTQVVDLRRDE
ncbi:hypothetical protein Pla123a_03720 [Posidoniimonas polymericola]|uniref:PBS lyase HEAT-like repeat protein n=1 Tax=Posidoniimonas polymericola TaxID=2528002 RepID=A0A5C5ZEI3_9BACT|nr:hypothetical protein [Posidoniimonas polymericola]TWT85565.1 hypothetical protein Pla123a_03720 [Posidoniimonas polymericola]